MYSSKSNLICISAKYDTSWTLKQLTHKINPGALRLVMCVMYRGSALISSLLCALAVLRTLYIVGFLDSNKMHQLINSRQKRSILKQCQKFTELKTGKQSSENAWKPRKAGRWGHSLGLVTASLQLRSVLSLTTGPLKRAARVISQPSPREENLREGDWGIWTHRPG